MPPPNAMPRENLLRILEACRRLGVFHPRVDADSLAVDRAQVDEALDHLRNGGFVEIADWQKVLGQGYRLTAAGEAALADPRKLARPAVPQAPAVERTIRGSEDRGASVIDSLVHPRPAILTRILVFVNIAVFLVDAFLVAQQGSSIGSFLYGTFPERREEFIDFGQMLGIAVVRDNEWWRLVTYMFLHSGLLHIGCNMYVLYSIGAVMEGRLGWLRFAVLYFGSGLIAGIAVMMFEPRILVVGASGAICGVLTSLAAWAWVLRRYLPREFVQAHLRMVGINLLILVIIGTSKSVSNAGHAGGAIAGVLLTVPLILLDRHAPTRQRVTGAFLLAAIVIAALLLVEFRVIPSLSTNVRRGAAVVGQSGIIAREASQFTPKG
jgi:rhomboid protease GluP